MIRTYMKDLNYFLKQKFYMIFMISISTICYGYAAINLSIGIDDLESERYVGSGHVMLSAGRFGMVFWSKLFGYGSKGAQNSFAIDVLAVILFMWAATNCCILFRRISRDKFHITVYTVFSCILISYPLINEIWEYTGANICVCGGFLFVSFVLLLIWEQIHGSFSFKYVLVSFFMMMIVCSAYESLAIVYVFMVFAVLFLQTLFGLEKTFKGMVRQGMYYAGTLFAGLVLRIFIHFIILLVFNLERKSNGATGTSWNDYPIGEAIYHFFESLGNDYILKGIIYFPITEFLICIVLFSCISLILYKRNNCIIMMWPALGMLGSLFLLSLIQGIASPYRTCQVFAVFVAFTLMLLVYVFEENQKRYAYYIKAGVLGAMGCLCIWQAVYLNYLLTVNHQRSDEEAYVIRNIGTELEANYDTDKFVIFTGTYTLSDGLIESVSVPYDSVRWKLYGKMVSLLSGISYEEIYDTYSRKKPDTNVNSVINWSITAFGTQESMYKLFRYYGFEYMYDESCFFQLRDEAEAYVEKEKMPGYPKTGYIVDRGDYIIVNLE